MTSSLGTKSQDDIIIRYECYRITSWFGKKSQGDIITRYEIIG